MADKKLLKDQNEKMQMQVLRNQKFVKKLKKSFLKILVIFSNFYSEEWKNLIQ